MANLSISDAFKTLKANTEAVLKTRLLSEPSQATIDTLPVGKSFSVTGADGKVYSNIIAQAVDKPTDLTHPAWKEICLRITSTAENATLDWTSSYGYIEYNVEKATDGGQGYTGGLIGFTSRYGSMLSLVKRHKAKFPNGVMVQWLDALQRCYDNRNTNGSIAQTELGAAFEADWKAAASDPDWRQSQRALRDDAFWAPALARAIADGVGPLGLVILYDIAVNHGGDNGVNSMGGIATSAALVSPPPSQGGSEFNYLTALINRRMDRLRVMVPGTTSDTSGRVNAHRQLLWNNQSLNLPISFPMYGTTYTISSWPGPLPYRTQTVMPATVPPRIEPSSAPRLGMWAPGFPAVASVQEHEKKSGLGYSIVSCFRGATGGDLLHDSAIVAAAKAGYTPLVAWDMGSDASWKWSTWTSGSHDTYLKAVADQAKLQPDTMVYVRPWAEMNADFSVARVGGTAGGTVAEFLAAWKYVVNYFKNNGVTNIRWVWCPTTDTYSATTDVAALWPGSTYVDVIGLDGYNWGTGGNLTWTSFYDVFKVQYGRVAALDPFLPIWVCETGCKEPSASDGAAIDTSKSKSQWVADLYDTIATKMPRIRAVCWFSELKERDWRIDSSSSALKALVTSSGSAVRPDVTFSGVAMNPRPGLSLAIPSYFWPDDTWVTGDKKWRRANGVGASLMVANPNSGPGTTADNAFTNAINEAHARGVTVLGYVRTDYGRFSLSTIKASVDTWYKLYPAIDGIFFDESDNGQNQYITNAVSFYGELVSYAKSKGTRVTTVINPGTDFVSDAMNNVADISMTFEHDVTTYLAKTSVPAASRTGTTRHWHCVYGATSDQVASVLAKAKELGATYLYITDDVMPNPYDSLPSSTAFLEPVVSGVVAPSSTSTGGGAAVDSSALPTIVQ